jgi:hypothetical protein
MFRLMSPAGRALYRGIELVAQSIRERTAAGW